MLIPIEFHREMRINFDDEPQSLVTPSPVICGDDNSWLFYFEISTAPDPCLRMGAITVWSTAGTIDDGVGQDEDEDDEHECVPYF